MPRSLGGVVARRSSAWLPPTRPAPFIALMFVGFLVGTVGHIYKTKTLVAIGIGLIFLATLCLPLGLYLSDR